MDLRHGMNPHQRARIIAPTDSAARYLQEDRGELIADEILRFERGGI
jgi:hypothetical protein